MEKGVQEELCRQELARLRSCPVIIEPAYDCASSLAGATESPSRMCTRRCDHGERLVAICR